MKKPSIFILALLLAGCVTSGQHRINEEQARSLAVQLADVKADLLYHCHPFQDDDSPPARFIENHWVWTYGRGVGLEDIQARVDLAADGSTNNVDIKILDSKNSPLPPPNMPPRP